MNELNAMIQTLENKNLEIKLIILYKLSNKLIIWYKLSNAMIPLSLYYIDHCY